MNKKALKKMRTMSKQNSVEWLVEQLKSQYDIDIERLSVTDKAKQMHKEEIKEAVDFSNKKWSSMKNEVILNGQQYYNETFGGQDNE